MGLRAARGWGGSVAALVVLVVGTLGAPSATAAQRSLRAADVAVELGPERATVRVAYEVVGGGAGDSVEISLLEHPGRPSIDVRDDRGATVHLANTSRTRRAARVPLGASPGGVTTLRFVYDAPRSVVLAGGELLARVPLLSIAVPPVPDAGDVFTATVRVPDDWAIAEAFPSGLRSVEPGVYRAALPVVPSMVSVRGRTDGRWRPGVDLVVELLTGAILLAFALAGWRHLGRTT